MTVKEIFDWGKGELKKADVQEPETSAEFLLGQALGVKRAKLYSMLDEEVRPLRAKKYRGYIERRKNHEPVWQIVGKVEFWGMEFAVDKNVLVPRPETELLVEKALDQVKSKKLKVKSILDVGTGSGAIVISLAKELKQSDFYASDISAESLKIARKNAKSLGFDGKIVFKLGNLFIPWKSQKFDIITANLPYIPHADLSSLALDVHHHEPRVALDGGLDGLEIYEKFLQALPSHLNPGGMVFCEIGEDQGKKFCQLAKKYLPKANSRIIKDLAGIDRIAIIKS